MMAREMRTVRGTATGGPYCQTAICTSVNIIMGLGTVKVFMCSKMVPVITATGGTDRNTVKEPFGTLTERDMKGNGKATRNTASAFIITRIMTCMKARGRGTFATVWERICTLIQERNLWVRGWKIRCKDLDNSFTRVIVSTVFGSRIWYETENKNRKVIAIFNAR